MPCSMPQRSSQPEGTSRTFGTVCSISRRTLRPTLLNGSALVFTSESSRPPARPLCSRKSTVPARPWKHAAGLVAHVHPAVTSSLSRKRQNLSNPKSRASSGRTASAGGPRGIMFQSIGRDAGSFFPAMIKAGFSREGAPHARVLLRCLFRPRLPFSQRYRVAALAAKLHTPCAQLLLFSFESGAVCTKAAMVAIIERLLRL